MSHINSKNYFPNREIKVTKGIDILLSLFSTVKQQRIFPRNIMTRLTNGQVTINSVEEMMKNYAKADYKDCRINAYPAFVNEAEKKDYEKGINMDLFIPNILFIDLDLKDFPSKVKLDKTMSRIIRHISKILVDSYPLVLWSGRGYHVIIPVKTSKALEQFEDFSKLIDKPSDEFLKFAKSFLTIEKADNANNPAIRSCLLRVPYTFNSRCINKGIDPEVKVIQEFDSSKSLPKIDNLLVEFMTFLSDRKLKENIKKERQLKLRNKYFNNKTISRSTLPYVEKLLTIPIKDYRKNTINLILAPYFVNVLRFSDEDSFNRIKQWILKCNEVELLKPSIEDFDTVIKNAVKRSKKTGIKPLKFNDTLQYRNKKLYDTIVSTPFVKQNY